MTYKDVQWYDASRLMNGVQPCRSRAALFSENFVQPKMRVASLFTERRWKFCAFSHHVGDPP